MTKRLLALCLSLCLLPVWTTPCAAADGVARLAPKKMVLAPAEGGEPARWEAAWDDQGVSVGFAYLDGDGKGGGWSRLELVLSDDETGRAYFAAYDKKRNSARCSIVVDFQDQDGSTLVEAGEGFLEISDEMDGEDEAPMFAHSYEVQGISVGYRLEKKGKIFLCLVDMEEERAYYLDYDPGRRAVGGEVVLDLSGGE